MGIACIDNEIASFEMWHQVMDYIVHHLAGWYQHHNRARLGKRFDKFIQALHGVYGAASSFFVVAESFRLETFSGRSSTAKLSAALKAWLCCIQIRSANVRSVRRK